MALSIEETQLKRTPLYDYYTKNDIKLVDFGSWALPIQFTKLIDEHHAVRERVGLFDVSHMGEIEVKGDQATTWLNKLITNDLSAIDSGQALYTLVTKETGGILDDIIIFKKSDTDYLLTPNASNTEKIRNWLLSHQDGSVTIEDQSLETGLIAIQGPDAVDVVASVFGEKVRDLKNYHFAVETDSVDFTDVLVSRTGYTGEDGFECYVKWDQTEDLWNAFKQAGNEYSIAECGLGSRDTLRLEAGMPLYGHDLSEDITPLEAGLRFAVKWDKADKFIGQDALEKQKETGVDYLSRGFELLERGIAREGYPVFNESDEEIGVVTSGTQSPTLGKSIGFLRMKKAAGKLGDTVYIQVRKNKVPAQLIKKTFLKQ
ncbi:MAG: glycine cleavage system aminomethyltransferase GcvT [Alkalibacterium sp.]|nr:glycine cleavage system aminomethyltransferase GcvT [Alkalibacterium sp.]